MNIALAAAVVALLLPPASSRSQDEGGVRGTVRLRGQAPPGKKYHVEGLALEGDKLYPHGLVIDPVLVDSENRISKCLVYVRKGLEGRSFEPPADPKTMAFDSCMLRPRVLGIMVGQELEIRNRDRELHNAHVIPWQNKETNRGLPPGGELARRTFSEPEVGMRVHCDVHPWEWAWITALPHPFFAVTDEHGGFRIDGLPPGKYELEAWQENCLPARLDVTVGKDGSASGDFILELRPPLKNELWTWDKTPLFQEWMDKPVEVYGLVEFLPAKYSPPEPLPLNRRCILLKSDRVRALCSLAAGEEDRLRDVPPDTRLQVRGVFKGPIPSDGARFVLTDCVIAEGLKYGK